jgi:hypothetical protein
VLIDGLKHRFSRFLRRRRVLQHFGRHPLVDTLAAHGPLVRLHPGRLLPADHLDEAPLHPSLRVAVTRATPCIRPRPTEIEP